MQLSLSGASSVRGIPGAVRRSFPTPHALLSHACGVDISDASIKWITLTPGPERGRRVMVSGSAALPEGIVSGGLVRDALSLSAALKEIRPHMGLTAAHAALPEEAAYVFSMPVPDGADRKQILAMVEFEFDGRVPIAPSAAVYDYTLIARREGEGQEIGVVVFPKEVAEAYAQGFEGAGIELLSLEVEARSVARAVSSSEADEPIELLVDFGQTRTGFAVLKRGIPIFTSTVPVGGDSLIGSVQKALSISSQEAEHFSNFEGLASEDPAKKSGKEALVSTASALSDEVARHYHYWDTRRGDKGERVTPVGRIVLVGGSANARGLPEYIAGRVQAPVSLGNVWRHVCDFNEYIPPIERRASLQYATAIGLALRGI